MFFVVALISIILAYFLLKFGRRLDYWEKRGVPGPEPSRIFGNVKDAIFMRKTSGEIFAEIYKKFKDLPYVGVYNMRDPHLLVRDVDLVRDIFIKEFKSFHDNFFEVNENVDILFGRNPFVARGELWKVSRTQLLPLLAADKVKSVISKIANVCQRMVDYIDDSEDKIYEVKKLASRCTTDMVFSMMYSMDMKSFDDRQAVMWKRIRKIFAPSTYVAIRNLLIFLFPWLATVLKIGIFSAELEKSLIKLAMETKKARQNSDEPKNDIFDVLAESKQKGTDRKLTDLEMAAHTSGFIMDGVETTGSILSYLLYELAANPTVQNKVYREIISVLEANGNVVSPDSIQEMSYLEQTCYEALRKHPILLASMKVCTENFTLKAASGEKLAIEKGTIIVIPTSGIQMDPKFFPNPEIFDPDRFSPENKPNILRGSYLGFGDGPRICTGKRMGLTQLKVAIVYILNHFEMKVDERTKVPLEVETSHFMKNAKGGLWIKFIKRNHGEISKLTTYS